jgi:hypothetical protein
MQYNGFNVEHSDMLDVDFVGFATAKRDSLVGGVLLVESINGP